MSKLVDISNEVFLENDSPTDLSIASISQWFRGNYKSLNNILNKNYFLNDSLEITNGDDGQELGEDEAAIFKKMHSIHYLTRKIRQNLGAAGVNVLLDVTADGATVRTVDRTRISSVYIQLRKEETAELKILVNSYKIKHSSNSQVVGDDIHASRRNFVDEWLCNNGGF